MTKYTDLLQKLTSLLEGISYDISILANTSALLYEHIDQINWVGFYINVNTKLLLGPFQGKVACSEIPFSKGVCGACASSKETILVSNVHEFKGHIACDHASKSEICIPIFIKDKLYAILDIDSPIYNRFKDTDKLFLENVARIISKYLEKV